VEDRPSSRRKGRQRRGGSHPIRPVIHVPPSVASKSLVQRYAPWPTLPSITVCSGRSYSDRRHVTCPKPRCDPWNLVPCPTGQGEVLVMPLTCRLYSSPTADRPTPWPRLASPGNGSGSCCASPAACGHSWAVELVQVGSAGWRLQSRSKDSHRRGLRRCWQGGHSLPACARRYSNVTAKPKLAKQWIREPASSATTSSAT
jgi:hypothetical protein